MTSATAWANYSCRGPIDQVEVGPDGAVWVWGSALGFNYVALCAVSTAFNGVQPDACKAILATLLSAHATGALVDFWFSDSLTCTTHPAWAPLTGWYWGPNLVTP